MSDRKEIKPCDCRSAAIVATAKYNGVPDKHRVCCEVCLASTTWFRSKEEAVSAWNRGRP